jgi:hypothetical protein
MFNTNNSLPFANIGFSSYNNNLSRQLGRNVSEQQLNSKEIRQNHLLAPINLEKKANLLITTH